MDPGYPDDMPVRKRKFQPKAPPPRRVPKVEVKTEVKEEAEAVDAKDLLRRFNESSARGRPKSERKAAPVEVAFGIGGSSSKIRSFGVPKQLAGRSVKNEGGDEVLRQQKEYKEHWDYYSYYPTTLPLRRPYMGNPELLDENEFGGESSESRTYNENATNQASELGLMEENTKPQLLLVQLPRHVPMTKRSATADSHHAGNRSKPPGTQEKICGMNDLPAGLMGKLLVYKSGAVKLRLGDNLYDVSSGMNCSFAQNIVAINTLDKQCCNIGEINRRAVLTPDMESVLDGIANL